MIRLLYHVLPNLLKRGSSGLSVHLSMKSVTPVIHSKINGLLLDHSDPSFTLLELLISDIDTIMPIVFIACRV